MSVYVADYSEKSVAVFGETKPIKDYLLAAGGLFNERLNNKISGNREPGWIFVKNKEKEVKELAEKANKGLLPKKDSQSSPISESDMPPILRSTRTIKTADSKPVFEFTKEMYLALVSRIEKLENDNAILVQSIQDGTKLLQEKKSLKKEVGVEKSKKVDVKVVQRDDSEEEDEEEDMMPSKSFLSFGKK
jgi:hypothetical protein